GGFDIRQEVFLMKATSDDDGVYHSSLPRGLSTGKLGRLQEDLAIARIPAWSNLAQGRRRLDRAAGFLQVRAVREAAPQRRIAHFAKSLSERLGVDRSQPELADPGTVDEEARADPVKAPCTRRLASQAMARNVAYRSVTP